MRRPKFCRLHQAKGSLGWPLGLGSGFRVWGLGFGVLGVLYFDTVFGSGFQL